MPFKSQAQRRMMYAEHPEIAARWEAETPPGPLPAKKKPSKPSTTHTRSARGGARSSTGAPKGRATSGTSKGGHASTSKAKVKANPKGRRRA